MWWRDILCPAERARKLEGEREGPREMKWKWKRVHRKETAPHLLCCVSLHVCDIFYRYRHKSYSELLVWCPYDCPQVIFSFIFACGQNRRDSESQDHMTQCERSNLLSWMLKWKVTGNAAQQAVRVPFQLLAHCFIYGFFSLAFKCGSTSHYLSV